MNRDVLDVFEGDFDYVDLTHPLRVGMPVWPDHPAYEQRRVASLERGDRSCNHALCLSEHTGTHFDAPAHFILGGRTIASVPVRRFFGRLATLEASDQAPDSEVGIDRLLEFEARHGAIRVGDAVMFSFGWARFWAHPEEGQRFLRDWPGLSRQASAYLVERGVRLVGSDCLSIDRYGSADFPAHNTLLAADILIGENFARLDRLPPWSTLVAFPLPIEGGSGSPVRAIALIASP
jgi:kynurenine formamidase